MRSALRVACAAALALLPSACEERQHPLGPTALDEGIIIYLHSGFRGTSQAIATDVQNLGAVEGPCPKGDSDAMTLSWDDCVSSIRVMAGWGATIYRDRDFKGASLEVTADLPDLSAIRGSCDDTYNDCISSLRVYRR